jgi:hypothetical protein
LPSLRRQDKLIIMELLIDNHHGIYQGQIFAECYLNYMKNKDEYSEEIADLLAGPDSEHYTESWVTVSDNAILVDDKGIERTILFGECGDVFAVTEEEAEEYYNEMDNY